MFEYHLEHYCKTTLPLAVWDEKGTRRHQPVHVHNCIEMVFIYGGAGSCAVDGVHYAMLPGDIYIIPAGATHEYFSDPSLKFYNIMFDRTLFTAGELPLYERFEHLRERRTKQAGLELKYTFSPGSIPFITELCRQIEQELNLRREYFEYNAKALFFQFLIFFIRNIGTAAGVNAADNQHRLSRVFDYISRHYTEKITLPQLAALTGNSPAYLGKQFRRLVGVNISDYICRYRIEKARYELENSDDSVAEIAFRLGFCDASYFVKSFQRFCGATPAQYRGKKR